MIDSPEKDLRGSFAEASQVFLFLFKKCQNLVSISQKPLQK